MPLLPSRVWVTQRVRPHPPLEPSAKGRPPGRREEPLVILRAAGLAFRRRRPLGCDLDHPRAPVNHLARGLRVFKVETRPEELPDAPLELWPGAKAG